MATEPNYVLTVTVTCPSCHTAMPIPFDTGVPLGKVRFPYRATKHYECPTCHLEDDVSIDLNHIPGGLPGQN
jgi:hypothetical protein